MQLFQPTSLAHVATVVAALTTTVSGLLIPHGLVKRQEPDECSRVRYSSSSGGTVANAFPGNDERAFQTRRQFLDRCCKPAQQSRCLARFLYGPDEDALLADTDKWVANFARDPQPANRQLVSDYKEWLARYAFFDCVAGEMRYTPETWKWTFTNWLNVKGRSCFAKTVPQVKEQRLQDRYPNTLEYGIRCGIPRAFGLGQWIPCPKKGVWPHYEGPGKRLPPAS